MRLSLHDRFAWLQRLHDKYCRKYGLSYRLALNSRIKRTLGRCCYSKRLLELATTHVAESNFAQVVDTLLHEIAHALAYQRFGQVDHHGPQWQSCAIELGAKPVACKSGDDVAVPKGKFQGTCRCRTHHWYNRPRCTVYTCRYCNESFQIARVQ